MLIFRIYLLLMCLASVFIVSCASFKDRLIKSGCGIEAIENAIADFSKSGGLYKKDSVFFISFSDTVYRMVLEKSGTGSYNWKKGGVYEKVVAVGIRPTHHQFMLTPETKAGLQSKLPTRFVEVKRKLFYWWDDNYPLTEATLKVFKKYNLFQVDHSGLLTVPENDTNDTQKGVHYYFCRKDLSEYKKVVTYRGMGYYVPPKIDCESK